MDAETGVLWYTVPGEKWTGGEAHGGMAADGIPKGPRGNGYRLLGGQLSALMEGERDALANLANAAALIYQALPDLNWAGFYLYKQGMLVLGPFQGMPGVRAHSACARGVRRGGAREANPGGPGRARLSRPYRLRRGLQKRNRGAAA